MKIIWSAQQRQDTYNLIRTVLNRFILDDHHLIDRINNNQPDSYPTNSMPGPGQHGGITDRVANAVTIRTSNNEDDPAQRALALVHQAAQLLAQADSHRARALPSTSTSQTINSDSMWCVSHLRYGYCEPRSTRQGGRQDLCSWCQDEWLGSSKNPTQRELPPRPLIEAHDRGIRLTDNRRKELTTTTTKQKTKSG